MTAQSFGVLFTAGTFVFALLVYLIYMQWRRAKYREMASALGAQYQSRGLFNTGEIIGSWDGRAYKIETKDAGRGGMWTVTSLPCRNRGLELSVYGGFFKSFPYWKSIFVNGAETGSSGLRLVLSESSTPLEEKYKSSVQGLFQEAAILAAAIFKKGHLRIERDSISFTRHGVVTQLEVTRQLISQLAEIAGRIEAEPVL